MHHTQVIVRRRQIVGARVTQRNDRSTHDIPGAETVHQHDRVLLRATHILRPHNALKVAAINPFAGRSVAIRTHRRALDTATRQSIHDENRNVRLAWVHARDAAYHRTACLRQRQGELRTLHLSLPLLPRGSTSNQARYHIAFTHIRAFTRRGIARRGDRLTGQQQVAQGHGGLTDAGKRLDTTALQAT